MKSPEPHRFVEDGFSLSNRIGGVGDQDWFQSVAVAARKLRRNDSAQILIVSCNRFLEGKKEVEVYVEALEKLGVDMSRVKVIEEGDETVSQIEAALRHSDPLEHKLFLVSPLHSWRVKWILRRNERAEVRSVFGLPRPSEALTDIAMTFLFPIIDIFGKREWFLKKVATRRADGQL